VEPEPESEPLIYRSEVLAIIGALADLVVEVRDIRDLLGKTMKKRSKKEIREQARREAENSPIVRQLRELYARGMAELQGREDVSRYVVVIEGSGDSYSAFVPDLPGCVAVGATLEEVERLIVEAIRLHIESMSAHGEVVPEPRTEVRFVGV
jgi:predicted RNase H-like HicB family nuclease